MQIGGFTGTTGTTDWVPIIRAADEGVPLGAIKRIFRPDPEDLRDILHAAVSEGRIICVPPEDWPTTSNVETRTALYRRQERPAYAGDTSDLRMKLARVLKTTPQETTVISVLLRKECASNEQLHDAIEGARNRPDSPTDLDIIKVVICKLRQKLKPYDIYIDTMHSFGYQMDEENKQKVSDLLEKVGG